MRAYIISSNLCKNLLRQPISDWKAPPELSPTPGSTYSSTFEASGGPWGTCIMDHLHERVWSRLRSWSRAMSFTPNLAFVYPSQAEQVMNTTDVEPWHVETTSQLLDSRRPQSTALAIAVNSNHSSDYAAQPRESVVSQN